MEAAKLETEFCLMVRKDGTIVYSDVKYNARFEESIKKGLRGLDILVAYDGIRQRDKNKILRAVAEGLEEKVPIVFVDSVDEKGEAQNSYRGELIVKPLRRPRGYVILKAVQVQDHYQDFLHVLSQLSMGYYTATASGEVTFCNDVLLQWLGCDESDILARNILLNMHVEPVDDTVLHTDFLTSAFYGEVFLISKKRNKKRAYICHDVGQKQNNIDDEVEGYILPCVVANDEQKHDTTMLDGSWEHYIEHSPFATGLLDVEGNITKSNAAFRRMLDIGKVGNAQKNIADVITKGKGEAEQLLQQVLKTNEKNYKPVEITIKSAEDISASLYLSKVIDGQGNIEGIIVRMVDTTEQKNLEMHFAHSQKMQAVGQLAGGIAHDFNNLLTAMMGFCDLLLLKHPAGDPSFADIMQIKQNANRAAGLVRQLLAFSRKTNITARSIRYYRRACGII